MRAALVIALALLAAGLGLAGRARADDGDFQIIVHPDNPATSLDRGFLRDVYLKKATSWRSGAVARPIDLPAGHVRDRYTKTVLRKTRAQLRSYWNQQIFSGKGVPPPAADSPDAVIAFVRSHPGAVGYVPAGADVAGTKVVRLSN
jgi:ABC-type phosphate transport system substrate-binding protein